MNPPVSVLQTAKAVLRLTVATLLFATVVACAREDSTPNLSLPETPVLSARESWGVAEQAYVRVYAAADDEAGVVGHLRSGVVSEITARIVSPVGGGRDGWVQVRREDLSGWVRRGEIELFDTRERAENASRAIRGD